MLGCDEAGALELTGCPGMARTPVGVRGVIGERDVIPAGVAGVPVDYTIGRIELIQRMGEATDHDHRRPGGPRKPGEAAGDADEGGGVAQPTGPLGKRTVAGFILTAGRHLGNDQAIGVV